MAVPLLEFQTCKVWPQNMTNDRLIPPVIGQMRRLVGWVTFKFGPSPPHRCFSESHGLQKYLEQITEYRWSCFMARAAPLSPLVRGLEVVCGYWVILRWPPPTLGHLSGLQNSRHCEKEVSNVPALLNAAMLCWIEKRASNPHLPQQSQHLPVFNLIHINCPSVLVKNILWYTHT